MMNPPDITYAIANWLVGTGALLAWLFVALFSRYDWKVTDEGRHIMSFTVMVGIILSLAVGARLFGPYPGQQYVAVALYGWLVYLLARRVWLMCKANRARSRD